MGSSQREKGFRAELAVRDLFRAAGFDCDRVPASGGLRIRGDLYGDVPLHVEVKRQERLQLGLWLRQAAEDSAGGPYVVAFRQSHEEWYGALALRFLLPLLRRAPAPLEAERDALREALEAGVSGVENLPVLEAEEWLRVDWLPAARAALERPA